MNATQLTTFVADYDQRGDAFGQSVALSSGIAVSGAYGTSGNEAAYIFDATVPEPSTFVLLDFGLFVFVACRRRKCNVG